MKKLSKITEGILGDIARRDLHGGKRKENVVYTLDDLERLVDEEIKKQGENINLNHIDVSNIDSLERLFCNFKNIKSIDLTGWNTSGVVKFNGMFDSCVKLQQIKGIENWNVYNGKYFYNMFDGCHNLKQVNLENWDVSNGVDFTYMFYGCQSLEQLNLGNWDVSNVESFRSMFENCKNLKQVNLGNWDVSNGVDFTYMFGNCPNLKQAERKKIIKSLNAKYIEIDGTIIK